MADKTSKTDGNAPGTWYVDTSCIGCSLCAGTAPDVFSMSDDGSAAYVAAQPAGSDAVAQAVQALSDCPVNAIGNDA